MDIFKLLDEIEDMIQSSKKVPLYGKVMISEEVILDYLDKIRTALPEEIHQAKWLSKERERVIEEARAEAERIIAAAREESNKLASKDEVTRQAQAAAEEMMTQAKRVSREIRSGANAYADDILGKLEEQLTHDLEEIRQAREELKQSK